MSVLYLICDLDGVVFNFEPASNGTWEFSRLSKFHRDNGKDRFVFRKSQQDGAVGWVLENQSGQAKVFGTPKYSGDGPPFRGSPSPPRGMWTVWGCPFVLSDTMPQKEAITSPFTFKVPFAQMCFREEGNLAYLEIEVFNAAIDDEKLDEILEELRRVLVNLAQRPEMVLLLRTDARSAQMPSMRHVRKFLAFIQKEVGTECVLVGRGSAIILAPSTFLGAAVLRLVQLVQRMLPAPYPQAIVATSEEANHFLSSLEELKEPKEPKESKDADVRNEDKCQVNSSKEPAPIKVFRSRPIEEVEAIEDDMRPAEPDIEPPKLTRGWLCGCG